jgi:hypothetical protein
MKAATTAQARTEDRDHDSAPPSEARRSGRRIKAAAAQSPELALAMTDALEDILDYERRTA